MFRRGPVAIVFAVACVLVGCVADETEPAASADDGGAVDGTSLAVRAVVGGLDGPTQFAVGPDGTWFVAQLSGGENDEAGSVVPVDPATGVVGEAVRTGLDKPTGVAVFDGRLWVQERRRLTVSTLDGSEVEVVVDDMAFNGRSSGSLSVDVVDGGERLLFATTGSLRSRIEPPASPTLSSGVLWAVGPDGAVEPVGSGFKNAYAQVRASDGTLWTVEIADGVYDGEVALDEVVAVAEGADHGWPHCVDDNRPVAEFDGTAERCADVPGSLIVFDRGATPTSIVESPWQPGELLVALWNAGEVVSVPADGGAVATLLDSVERPQQLVVDDGRLYLIDFGNGEILELSAGA